MTYSCVILNVGVCTPRSTISFSYIYMRIATHRLKAVRFCSVIRAAVRVHHPACGTVTGHCSFLSLKNKLCPSIHRKQLRKILYTHGGVDPTPSRENQRMATDGGRTKQRMAVDKKKLRMEMVVGARGAGRGRGERDGGGGDGSVG